VGASSKSRDNSSRVEVELECESYIYNVVIQGAIDVRRSCTTRMTRCMPNRNQSALRDSAQARFAVEALFQSERPRGEAADVDVVVKRRRIAPMDNRVDGNDVAAFVAGEVRTPRIFKVEKQQQQESPKGASEAKTDGESRLGVAVSSPEVTQVRRRRRRLNGEVTIIRPPSQERKAVGDEPTRAKPDSQPQSSALGRFGVDLEEQRRHEKLLARIALLERQAQRARNTEAATAIRWIKKAINEYGIEASEVGF